ncbi:uncharacterized conserved protein (plasmid) [Borrelia duttonii Ly]|uniref:Uncharacterized conserved protein n=2 Tax=Borrelia duttonii TaxID=40834 RepID=B5RNJ9_BORDL|nr:uncharacterized conserved protein [Borrelia duttonii Ly]
MILKRRRKMTRYNDVFILLMLISIVSCKNAVDGTKTVKDINGNARNGSRAKSDFVVANGFDMRNGPALENNSGIDNANIRNDVDRLSKDDIVQLKTFITKSVKYARSLCLLIQEYHTIYSFLKNYVYCVNGSGNCDNAKLTKESIDVIIKMKVDNIVDKLENILNYFKIHNPKMSIDSIEQLKKIFKYHVNSVFDSNEIKMDQVVDVVKLIINAYENVIDTAVNMYADMFYFIVSQYSSKKLAEISKNFVRSIRLCMKENDSNNILLVQIMISVFESIFLNQGDIRDVKENARKLFFYRRGKELSNSIDELYVVYHIARLN